MQVVCVTPLGSRLQDPLDSAELSMVHAAAGTSSHSEIVVAMVFTA